MATGGSAVTVSQDSSQMKLEETAQVIYTLMHIKSQATEFASAKFSKNF